MNKNLIILLVFGFGIVTHAQEIQYETKENIGYYEQSVNQSDAYIDERCVLDIYYPTNREGYTTIVWFHGGAFKFGDKKVRNGAFIQDCLKLSTSGVFLQCISTQIHPLLTKDTNPNVYISEPTA